MGDLAGWAVDNSARCSFQHQSSAIPRLIGKQACESSMAYTSTQGAFSSSTLDWKYDVFLSFCGEDTRKKFTDHLYYALNQKGIIVFRDDEKLERGTYISHQLLKAIQESQYAVIIISENYSSSKWCLMELTKIVECKRQIGLTILPIFYHVDPSDMRKCKGIFATAFARHRETTDLDKEQWKAALKEVSDLAGWHIHDRLHANEDDPRDSLVFYVPEAPHVGPNGFWVFIKDLNYFNPGGKSHLKISIATKSLNVELKDCGARLVSGDNVLEFYEILLRISPCGLDIKSLKDYLPRMQSFYAKGPIKEDHWWQ